MDGEYLRGLRLRYGLTQTQVAAAAGLRQPDLSALEHGRRGTAETHQRVRRAIQALVRPSAALDDPATRAELVALLEQHGAADVRVFGSTARGTDTTGSDLDLIARFPEGFDLLDLMALEEQAEELTGLRVDIVSDSPEVAHSLAGARDDARAL